MMHALQGKGGNGTQATADLAGQHPGPGVDAVMFNHVWAENLQSHAVLPQMADRDVAMCRCC